METETINAHHLSPDRFNAIIDTVELHIKKSKDYGDTYNELGVQGQFSDINRKHGKLKRALWEGERLVGEDVEEILMDLAGHCFVTIALLRRQQDAQ